MRRADGGSRVTSAGTASTLRVAVSPTAPATARMEAVPGAMAVTRPSASTTAMSEFLDTQKTLTSERVAGSSVATSASNPVDVPSSSTDGAAPISRPLTERFACGPR